MMSLHFKTTRWWTEQTPHKVMDMPSCTKIQAVKICLDLVNICRSKSAIVHCSWPLYTESDYRQGQRSCWYQASPVVAQFTRLVAWIWWERPLFNASTQRVCKSIYPCMHTPVSCFRLGNKSKHAYTTFETRQIHSKYFLIIQHSVLGKCHAPPLISWIYLLFRSSWYV